MATSRDIYVRKSTLVPKVFIESLFVTELIHPSNRVWLVSAWITDLDILDNSSRKFSSINPEWPSAGIKLSKVIETFLSHGTEVICVMNNDIHNEEIASRFSDLKSQHHQQLKVLRDQELHEKGILTDNFTLDGSMNLTYRGININQEFIRYSCDMGVIAQKKLAMEENYRDIL